MTVHGQRLLSNSSFVCVPPYEYVAPPYEYVESSSDTSDTEEEENHVGHAAGGTHDGGIQPSDTAGPT